MQDLDPVEPKNGWMLWSLSTLMKAKSAYIIFYRA